MKTTLATILCLASMSLVSTGCGPRPIVEEQGPQTPAVDVDISPDQTDVNSKSTNEDATVKVQVGGGQGVQVETERSE